MNNPDLVKEIITSPAAGRMLKTVTKDFYNDSYTGLWMFEVIGKEYDPMGEWAKNLRYETRPQTCTWSIGIWEFIYGLEPDETLTLEARRQRIISKRLSRPPLNPDRIAFMITEMTRSPVNIADPIAPYTFRVIIDENENTVFDSPAVIKTLRKKKPSHLSLDVIFNILIITFKNIFDFVFVDLKIGSILDETVSRNLAFKDFKFGVRGKNGNNLSGKIKMDNLWILDGSVRLDGSRKLNAYLIEEDI